MEIQEEVHLVTPRRREGWEWLDRNCNVVYPLRDVSFSSKGPISMRLVLRRVVSGYIEARYDALLAILWHVNYQPLRCSLSIPRAIQPASPVREFVCLYLSRHFSTSYAGSLCAGRSVETGTLDQPIRRLVRARPLTLQCRKSPRVHIPT